MKAKALDFLENMLDSGSDEENEITSKDSHKPVNTQSLTTGFNAMSLFAFTGDGQNDKITNVFTSGFSGN